MKYREYLNLGLLDTSLEFDGKKSMVISSLDWKR